MSDIDVRIVFGGILIFLSWVSYLWGRAVEEDEWKRRDKYGNLH